jgi:hypothetical protein
MPKEYETEIIRYSLRSGDAITGSIQTNLTFQTNISTFVEDGMIILEDCFIINANNDSDSGTDGAFTLVYEVNVHCDLVTDSLNYDTRTDSSSNILKNIPLAPCSIHGASTEHATFVATVYADVPKAAHMDLYYTNPNLSIGIPIKNVNLRGRQIRIELKDQDGDALDAALITASKFNILIINKKLVK